MSPARSSSFENTALTSGLLSKSDLLEAVAQCRSSSPGLGRRGPSDDALAAKLVDLAKINRWQAEQLLSGRTKFRLGPYKILDSIGQGGMGQVFKAEHMVMKRVVAVKVLPRHRSTPIAVDSFTREIRAQAQLDHENLVRAFDAGHDGNVYYLVTEFVEGTDLRRLVRRHGKLPVADAASVISQVAKGLAHAHERGLIHRDVKPGNVMVTRDGRAKLSDLGLAGYMDELGSSDPRAGKIVGTADYLSPEQIIAPRDVTCACDIYSLGCTLYYAVTGKVPYPGGTTKEKVRRHCESNPLNPRHFTPELDDEFLDVLCDMIEKQPEKRVQSATEVIERLQPWVKGRVELPTRPLETASASSPPVRAARASQFTTDLADTMPHDLDPPESSSITHSSPSQLSQGTDPITSAHHETLPEDLFSGIYVPRRRRRRWAKSWLLIGAGLGLIGTGLALGLLLL